MVPPGQHQAPRGRYAPSPTGELHLGNVSTALLAWLSVRARGGTFVMRMEDLDRNRVQSGLAERILEDLAWLGLDWDEGPDLGGPHPPYDQGSRGARYDAAFEKLRKAGRLYPCFCSRRDIAAAASAPQSPGDEVRYPGTCRGLEPQAAQDRVAAAARHAWRFRVQDGDRTTFDDLVIGRSEQAPPGDFVVKRTDGVHAYQLAVVVDDAEMRIDEVVRGRDLLSSTARQLLLFEALGHAPPSFGHVPLLLDPEGVRLSKRQKGITIRELREAGFEARAIVGRLARLLELRSSHEGLSASDLVADFELARLGSAPRTVTIDISTWSRE